eukprot:jgi/Mesen1/4906/ME000244S04079
MFMLVQYQAFATTCARPEAVLLRCSNSAQTLASRGEGIGTSEGGQQKRHLRFHLNDSNDVVLARAALLLLVASECDASSESDLDFLWAMWYHLALTKEQGARLSCYISRLASSLSTPDPTSVSLVNVPNTSTRGRVTNIVKKWQECHPEVSGLGAAKARRDVFKVAIIRERMAARQAGEHIPGMFSDEGSAEDVDEFIRGLSSRMSPQCFTDGTGGVSKAHRQAYQGEVNRWYHTGLTGQTRSSAAATAEEGLTANVTVIDVNAKKWPEDFWSCPFYTYFPLPAKYHPELGTHPLTKQARAQGPGSCNETNFLHRCCRDVLKDWVVGFQEWTQAGRVNVTLWGGDALQLCLYTLYPKPVDCPEREHTPDPPVSQSAGLTLKEEEARVEGVHGSRAAGGGCRFDAIETSTLADGVGLLNLLLCCAPLLKQHAHARLVTGTDLWYTVAPTVSAYAQLSLGFDARLLPSLLGLRLCNDFLFGTSSPPPQNFQGLQKKLPASCMEVLLEWAPSSVRCAATPGSSSCSGCGRASWSCDRGFLGDPATGQLTPLTLLGLGTRFDAGASLPPGSDDAICGITSALRVFTHGSHSAQKLFSHGWQAMLGFLAREKIGDLQAWNRWLLPAPSQSLTAKPITLYSKKLLGVPSFTDTSGPFLGWKGHVRLCLVVLKDEACLSLFLKHLPKLLQAQLVRYEHDKSSRPLSLGLLLQKTAVHIVDNFSVAWDDRRLVFPLPAGHGLPERLTAVTLTEVIGCKLVGEPALLSEFEKEAVPGVSQEGRHEQAGAHKEAASPEHEGRGGGRIATSSSSTAGTRVPAVSVAALSEHVDRYTGTVRFKTLARGEVRISGRQLEGEDCYEDAAWSVEIAVGSDTAVLQVAWPVVVQSATWQVSRKRGTVTFNLPKSATWPPVGAKKLRMEALQSWPEGSANDKRMELCLQGMFTLEEKGRLSAPNWAIVQLNFCQSVQTVFERFTKENLKLFHVRDVAVPQEVADTLTVLMHAVREAPSGFPVLEVVYNDFFRTKRMREEGKIDWKADARHFMSILEATERNGRTEILETLGLEVTAFRMLLTRCSHLVEPSSWQRGHMAQPGWMASFLPLVYSEAIYGTGIEIPGWPSLAVSMQQVLLEASDVARAGAQRLLSQKQKPAGKPASSTRGTASGAGASSTGTTSPSEKSAGRRNGTSAENTRRFTGATDARLLRIAVEIVRSATGLATKYSASPASLAQQGAGGVLKRKESRVGGL